MAEEHPPSEQERPDRDNQSGETRRPDDARHRLHLPKSIAPSKLRERISQVRLAAHEAIDEDFTAVPGAEAIPRAVKLTAGWAVRLILIGAGIYLLIWLLSHITVVVVPAVVSLLIAALLTPLVRLLRRTGMPRGLPPILAFLAGFVFIAGLITLIVQEFVGNYETVYATVQAGITQLTGWLSHAPFNMNTQALNDAINESLAKLQKNPYDVVNGTLTVVSTTGSALSGLLLTLFTTYFFLADGDAMWRWVAKLFPTGARWKVHRAGRRAWEMLVSYMSVTLLVALIVGIATGIACKIAGVPLALSAGLIAFLFAFIPTLGGLISSIVVVLLTLVSTSLTTAIVMAVVMIGIQTVQGNFIYPLLMNRQLKIHPLASLLLVVLGAVLGGIFGALIAVPLAAVVNTGWLDLFRASRGLPQSGESTEIGPDPDDDEDVDEDETLRDPTTVPAPAPGNSASAGEPDSTSVVTPNDEA